MKLDDIAALPVASIAEDAAHLFLWTLDRFLLDGSAVQVCRAWGFEPLPQLMVWRKNNPGLGMFVRSAHELILIGRRGEARLNPIAVASVGDWPQVYVDGAKKHSAKPDAALDTIERLSSGPYVELFARRNRFGWDAWGDEAFENVTLG